MGLEMLAATLPPIVPPFRYRIVEEGVLAGAYPTLRNFRFLRRLRLKTIISLTPEEPTYDLLEFCQRLGITHVHVQAEKFKESPAMLPHDYSTVVSLLIDMSCHPVYLHCLDGGNVTGQVIMLLRKLQYWTTDCIINEYTRWNVQNEVTAEEVQFLGEFNHPIDLPVALPCWLWGGTLIKSPPLKVRCSAPQPPTTGDEAGPSQPFSSQDVGKSGEPAGVDALLPAADAEIPVETSFFQCWAAYPEKLKDNALAHCKSASLDVIGHDLQLGHAKGIVELVDEVHPLEMVPHSHSCSDLRGILA